MREKHTMKHPPFLQETNKKLCKVSLCLQIVFLIFKSFKSFLSALKQIVLEFRFVFERITYPKSNANVSHFLLHPLQNILKTGTFVHSKAGMLTTAQRSTSTNGSISYQREQKNVQQFSVSGNFRSCDPKDSSANLW